MSEHEIQESSLQSVGENCPDSNEVRKLSKGNNEIPLPDLPLSSSPYFWNRRTYRDYCGYIHVVIDFRSIGPENYIKSIELFWIFIFTQVQRFFINSNYNNVVAYHENTKWERGNHFHFVYHSYKDSLISSRLYKYAKGHGLGFSWSGVLNYENIRKYLYSGDGRYVCGDKSGFKGNVYIYSLAHVKKYIYYSWWI